MRNVLRDSTFAAISLLASSGMAFAAAPPGESKSEQDTIAAIGTHDGSATVDESQPDRPVVGFSFNAQVVVTRKNLQLLHGLKHLRSLSLGNAFVAADGWAMLAEFVQLEELDLGGTTANDSGMVKLANLTNLKKLNVGNTTSITSAGVQHLAGLTQLESLDLWGTAVDDEGLKTVGGLRNLKILNLTGTKISDKGMADLRELTRLEELHLRGTKISGVGLEYLKQMTQLQRLSLSYPATDSLEKIAGLSHLNFLFVGCNPRMNDAARRQT